MKDFATLKLQREAAVLFAEIYAPPMNLMGPQLVSDLVSFIQQTEADNTIQVIVFKCADPDYFIAHVDVTQVIENREAAMKLNGEASLGLLFHHISKSRLVSIAEIRGRVRGIGSEFALACDMRFAATESAIFCQFEPYFGVIPGAGGVQHLARLLGRSRALEVMLSANDYDARLAEKYGWINRAIAANELGDFVQSLAHRIAKLPAKGRVTVKERVNAVCLGSTDEIRQDAALFGHGVTTKEYHALLTAATERGFQTRAPELTLVWMRANVNDIGS